MQRITDPLYYELGEACERGDLSQTKKLLEMRKDKPFPASELPPLFRAIRQPKIIEFLIDSGVACVNFGGSRRIPRTPLLDACCSHFYVTACLLLGSGADPSKTDPHLRNALELLIDGYQPNELNELSIQDHNYMICPDLSLQHRCWLQILHSKIDTSSLHPLIVHIQGIWVEGSSWVRGALIWKKYPTIMDAILPRLSEFDILGGRSIYRLSPLENLTEVERMSDNLYIYSGLSTMLEEYAKRNMKVLDPWDQLWKVPDSSFWKIF